MPDYSEGKIYKITSQYTTDVYIGSTCQSLADRFSQHKTDCKNDKKISSREIVKYEDCNMELIELYPCESKEELLKRERYWIEKHSKTKVNKQLPTRTKKEYNGEQMECPMCQETMRRDSLPNHIRNNHGTPKMDRVTCVVCETTCERKNLRRHMNAHPEERDRMRKRKEQLSKELGKSAHRINMYLLKEY